MIASALLTLFLVTVYQKDDWGRSLPCFAVLLTTAAAYHFYLSDTFLDLQEQHGYYVLHALFPLAAIVLLLITRFIAPSRLSACLMSLFTLYTGVILIMFWLDGMRYNVDTGFETTKLVVFGIEIALMLSTRLTDMIWGLHGRIRGSRADGNTEAYGRVDHDWLSSPIIHIRGDKT